MDASPSQQAFRPRYAVARRLRAPLHCSKPRSELCVKVVREVMSQMLDVWKQIPDVSDEFSPPPQSQASIREVMKLFLYGGFGDAS
ncbi:TORTIFOLIA1-like protein 3 [Senna tora]|uniref:TORTIFOLIA1-like protein 3 n=1 Tax=Senna tora TaxID=362788 RepID=A0A834WZV1_9FABA|nr:TORTIFOLIA1-like protein 3 [Senna tora]